MVMDGYSNRTLSGITSMSVQQKTRVDEEEDLDDLDGQSWVVHRV